MSNRRQGVVAAARGRGRARRRCALVVALGLVPTGLAASSLDVIGGAAGEGLFGLEVTIGSTCALGDDLLIEPPTETVEGDYEACFSVTASGVRVTGAGAVFRAGDRVALGNGFRIDPGVSFVAELERAWATPFADVETSTPADEIVYRARYRVKLDDLALADGDEIEHLSGYSGSGQAWFRLVLKGGPAGAKSLAYAARQDDGSFAESAPGQEIDLVAGWNTVEIDWVSARGTGKLRVSVNSQPFTGPSGLDNYDGRIASVRWGAIDGTLTATSGEIQLDSFESWR
jgi:hypothetical protein